ncbi:ureidoglycolate lyase [Pseudohalocynthiibacter aestuariivivens]|jgi:ureidoglycolate lyase|uniref:Ureidoglycolate lyase n=1 Tax=Pseudohalocynthiibacter aestuariivivens TaxID=1591409 RepID=A0ABV5JBD9_9RHOB|nr:MULTISPECIES: ureidoglycolate lyase [Pseudohalocynthiibacter]MBS9715673.1 ureidoglycolate lyase [Pseudohalocynthiibacter aestuariivivens]MCK0101286.1 ureidoglycolate lyase [Pseudohalocynthiibacter sp. F2068]
MNAVHQTLRTERLTQKAFAKFGDVLDASGEADIVINQGNCGRYHDRAQLDILNGRAGISVFKANPRSLPHLLDVVERHPEGSQAFLPMSLDPFLVIVAPDEGDKPGTPRAFITAPGQGVNIHRNIWHGVLTPLSEPGLFAVVDRIGDGANLQEHWFEKPWLVER